MYRIFLVLFAVLVVAFDGLTPSASVALRAPATAQASPSNASFGLPASPIAQVTRRRGAAGFNIVRAPAPIKNTARAASAITPRTRMRATSTNVALYNNLDAEGIDASDSNTGSPSDSTGAIGPSNYVEITNSMIAVYDRSLNLVGSKVPLYTWIPNGLVGVCDPQMQWDPSANRFEFLLLGCNLKASPQRFYFGWSKTADPSDLVNGWCGFEVDTGSIQEASPKLGHNAKYLIFAANGYDVSDWPFGVPFVTAQIIWVPKPSNGDTSCHLPATIGTTTGVLKDGDGTTPAFSPVPVDTLTNASNGYVVSAYDPSGANGRAAGPRSKLALWHLDSGGVLRRDTDITVNSYDKPFPAPQAGGTNLIDTSDGRLTQAVGDPTRGIWTQHTVNGAGNRSVVDWYEITAQSSPSLAQQGTVSSLTDFVFNAAIAPRFDSEGAGISYNRSSSLLDPVIAGQVRLTSTPAGTMESGEVLLGSSAAYDDDYSCAASGRPCAWGDYSGASPDPVQTNVVWGTNALTALAPDPGIDAQWGTRNFAVLVAVLPHAPTGAEAINGVAGGTGATIVWGPPSFDAGTPTTSFTVTAYIGSTPGPQVTAAGTADIALFPGLTKGVTYTFTVVANNLLGPSPESAHTNAVTIGAAAQSAPVSPLPLSSPNQSAPGSPQPR